MIVTRRSAIADHSPSPEKWEAARAAVKRALAEMTPEEDAAITADALSDPDCPPLPEDTVLIPWVEYEARRLGRTRVAVDDDLVARFRKTGDGWEERLNDALRAVAPAE